ncbi:T9SS type A sorting domain-containing protein [Chryseobacterium sp. RP-3-3]|uniref:T9SS type A sorting domain-containing protein n=1 Tax=Chryseobacterium antibioticum TaxID=2728847 RepID=A0A7Y0AM65_9FLAO|nr:choice-of-anchor J domain-containing protein [Chryseobacterium antibioticum]NML69891.1 T9SS type A sorting domain-containing protein [Chryseobacterium antibioticum]
MKKILFSLSVLLGITASNAQTVLLDENFDSYGNFITTGFGSWLTLDLDGRPTYTGGGPTEDDSWTANWANANAPMAFQIFNPSASNVTNNATPIPGVDEEVRNFSPHSGAKYAACWNATPPTGGTVVNNDWLISPPITLGAAANTLSLWTKSLSNSYGLEKYRIGIYVGSGTPTAAANFTIIAGAGAQPLLAPYPNWGQGSYSLDTYAGQTIRIGIQCVSNDIYMFMVDDIKVTTGTLSTSETAKTKNSAAFYPNPTKGAINIKTDKKVKMVSVMDMSGRTVMKTESDKTDISSLSKGTYIIKAEFNDGTSAIEKVIKQ